MTGADNVRIAPAGTYWATPAVLAGPYPGSRPTWAQLEGVGITRRIDLTQGEYAIRDYHTQIDALMQTILERIQGEIDRGGLVYVHCAGGIGRTGTVIGCLLAELGETDPIARLTELRRACGIGGSSPETGEQEHMVRDWVRRTHTDPLGDLDRPVA
jgi:protein-tyrosine phosphatase